jgi:hypothetical protein
MKNNWKEEFKSIEITEKRLDCLLDRRFGVFRLENLEDFIESLLAEQKKELLENERQFILNVLDGIDIADKEVGVIGGTQAIRQALQSRVI